MDAARALAFGPHDPQTHGSWSRSRLGHAVTGPGELLGLWGLGLLVCVMGAGTPEHPPPRLVAWPQRVDVGE